MNFLDSWIFKVVLDNILNKICRLIHNMYIIDNYPHEYKTRRIFDLDKMLLMYMYNGWTCNKKVIEQFFGDFSINDLHTTHA